MSLHVEVKIKQTFVESNEEVARSKQWPLVRSARCAVSRGHSSHIRSGVVDGVKRLHGMCDRNGHITSHHVVISLSLRESNEEVAYVSNASHPLTRADV